MSEMRKRNEGAERLTSNEDLLTEVLSRVPGKYVLRCKAVSKNWYSLISTPSFIKSHYQRAIKTNSADDNNEAASLIVHRWNDGLKEDGSFSLLELGGSDGYTAHLKFPFSPADYPFIPACLLVGCVCGIVCVCVSHVDDKLCCPTPDKVFDIYIWNPSTRQSKLIPQPTLYDCDYSSGVVLGFGFDPVDYDFKVVRVLRSHTIFPQVYSANKDAWRNTETKLTDFPPEENVFNICLHGFLFTMGYYGMMAFNLNKEVFICDIKPPISSHNFYDNSRIADFKDSIAVIFSEDPGQKINLWTLDDEACLCGGGVEASWTLMLSIDVDEEFAFYSVWGLFNSVEFLLDASDWLAYNSNRKVVRPIITDPSFYYEFVFKYTESQLVLLGAGSKLVNWSDDEDVGKEK